MKRFVIALAAALLIAGQFLSPVAAASTSSGLASEVCGDTYTVQHLDNLSKIASYCDTSVANILALNPQITNPNVIYSGQVIRLTGNVSSSDSDDNDTTYTVQSGDTLAEIADMFNTTVWAIMQANPSLWSYNYVYTGQVLVIPDSSSTTGGGTTTTTTYSSARVTLSDTTVDAGDSITVYVRGFPADSWIDYRVGEEDEEYSVVYDGTVDDDGEDDAVITIPSSADEGEYWVVTVQTTSQREGVTVTSARIYITD